MTNITTLRPGEHFMFKGFEWVCLDTNHPDGGVLAIMAKPWAKDVKFCPSDKFADEKGNMNNYRTSNVRRILSEMAMAKFVFERKSLLRHNVDLVADNGDHAYGIVHDFVFILTCDEYRKYRDYIPLCMYRTIDRGYFFNGQWGGEPTRGTSTKVLKWTELPLPESPEVTP